jgi:hypothetical protein
MGTRTVRAILLTMASLASCLVVAAPAQAATAAVTVTSVLQTSTHELTVSGTVTCSVPTGTAHVTALGTQVMPLVLGSGTATAPCASGPVAWHATVWASDTWDWLRPVSISVIMKDDNGGLANTAGSWWI